MLQNLTMQRTQQFSAFLSWYSCYGLSYKQTLDLLKEIVFPSNIYKQTSSSSGYFFQSAKNVSPCARIHCIYFTQNSVVK